MRPGRHPPSATLLGLAVEHVLAQRGVVPAQLKTVGVVFAVLDGGVGMSTLGAAQLDDDAVALFAGHDIPRKSNQ